MSNAPDLPVYAFTVHMVSPTGLPQESSGAITAAYFQESGPYTVFKLADHSVVEAFKTDYVTRIVRTEQPVDRRR